jgi:hypothetical protein
MARHRKTGSEALRSPFETAANYMKYHPWARNVWTAVLFLGAVYLVFRFIAPVLAR